MRYLFLNPVTKAVDNLHESEAFPEFYRRVNSGEQFSIFSVEDGIELLVELLEEEIDELVIPTFPFISKSEWEARLFDLTDPLFTNVKVDEDEDGELPGDQDPVEEPVVFIGFDSATSSDDSVVNESKPFEKGSTDDGVGAV